MNLGKWDESIASAVLKQKKVAGDAKVWYEDNNGQIDSVVYVCKNGKVKEYVEEEESEVESTGAEGILNALVLLIDKRVQEAGEVGSLKERIRALEEENSRLKGELSSLNEVNRLLNESSPMLKPARENAVEIGHSPLREVIVEELDMGDSVSNDLLGLGWLPLAEEVKKEGQVIVPVQQPQVQPQPQVAARAASPAPQQQVQRPVVQQAQQQQRPTQVPQRGHQRQPSNGGRYGVQQQQRTYVPQQQPGVRQPGYVPVPVQNGSTFQFGQ